MKSKTTNTILLCLLCIELIGIFFTPRHCYAQYFNTGFWIRRPMITKVQTSSIGSLGSISVGTTVTLSFTTPPKVGNHIIVAFWTWGNNVSSWNPNAVSDSYLNSYSLVNQKPIIGTDSYNTAIYYGRVSNTGSPFNVTINHSATPSVIEAVAIEYSGLAAINPISSLSALGTNPSANCGPITTTKKIGLLVSVINSTTGANPATVTPPSEFSSIHSQLNGQTYEAGGLSEKIVTTTGTYNATWTITSGQWYCVFAAFKAQE